MLSDPRPVVICYYFHYLPGNWVWLQFLCAVKIWGDLPSIQNRKTFPGANYGVHEGLSSISFGSEKVQPVHNHLFATRVQPWQNTSICTFYQYKTMRDESLLWCVVHTALVAAGAVLNPTTSFWKRIFFSRGSSHMTDTIGQKFQKVENMSVAEGLPA